MSEFIGTKLTMNLGERSYVCRYKESDSVICFFFTARLFSVHSHALLQRCIRYNERSFLQMLMTCPPHK